MICWYLHRRWWSYSTYYRMADDGTVRDIVTVAECRQCGHKWVRPAWESN